MKKHVLVIIFLGMAIVVMTVLITKLNSLPENLKMPDRISAYRAFHASKERELKSFYFHIEQHQSSGNPRVVQALRDVNRIVDFYIQTEKILDWIILFKNVPDSVQVSLLRCKESIETFQPVVDSMRVYTGSNMISLIDMIMMTKLLQDHPEISTSESGQMSGDLVQLRALMMRANLQELTLDLLMKLALITDCAPYRHFEAEHKVMMSGLSHYEYPSVMKVGKSERITLRLSGQMLVPTHYYSKFLPIADSLATNGLLSINVRDSDELKIVPVRPAEQYVPFAGYGTWEFDVTPYKAGKDTLEFHLSEKRLKPLSPSKSTMPMIALIFDVEK